MKVHDQMASLLVAIERSIGTVDAEVGIPDIGFADIRPARYATGLNDGQEIFSNLVVRPQMK